MPRTATPDVLTLFDALVYTCQYRLVIDPASSALARVMDWKQQLRERIGLFDGLLQMPGIVLFEAELPPDYERDLCDGIERGATGRTPFQLQLNGVAHSADRKTIFVAVEELSAVLPLRDRMVDHVRANRRIKKLGVKVVERPVLPIATGLKPDEFTIAWDLLTPHVFTSEQRVNDVVLMKRELANDSMDEHVRTFPLWPQQ